MQSHFKAIYATLESGEVYKHQTPDLDNPVRDWWPVIWTLMFDEYIALDGEAAMQSLAELRREDKLTPQSAFRVIINSMSDEWADYDTIASIVEQQFDPTTRMRIKTEEKLVDHKREDGSIHRESWVRYEGGDWEFDYAQEITSCGSYAIPTNSRLAAS